MPREKEGFRDQMERLNELFPEKEMLRAEDVMRVYGYKSKTTVRNKFPFSRGLISKVTLARMMCG